MADEEIRISASMSDDVSAAMARIEQRIKAVENELDKLGVKAAASGKAGAKGFDELGEAVEGAGREASRAKRPIDETGKSSEESGKKARKASGEYDRLGLSFKRAAKRGGGLGSVFTALKFAGLITGATALAGGLSALGAGAVIAIGGLAPMVGVLAGALPLFAAAKLSMLAWKLAATQLEPALTRIKNQFTELGPVIARGGLQSGVNYFANSIDKLAKASGKGLAGLGGELGQTARSAGDLAKSAPFLGQINTIFDGLRPIVRDISQGLLAVAQVLINVLIGALPMVQDFAKIFRDAAEWTRNWTAAQLANGNMTNWLNKSWEIFKRTIGVIVDIAIGLFNIFRIGGQYAGEMGVSVENLAYQFRTWTSSAEGQARINQYFQDALPALREMGQLLAMAGRGLVAAGANPNIAPLLNQIRTELMPALSELIAQLTGQAGLGPALITAATAFTQLLAGMDFSGLTMFIQALAGIASGVLWLTQNVPGASFVVSALLASFIGFKLLGPVFSTIAAGWSAFAWMHTALTATTGLTLAQRGFMAVMGPIGSVLSKLGGIVTSVLIPALKMIAIAGVGALRALSIALVTTPVGWIILAIMAIVGVIILLWTKCEWFRDAVKAVWEAIVAAAGAAWDWIKNAVSNTVDFFVSAWEGAVTIFRNVIDWIVEAAQWIYTKAIKPVMEIVVGVFEMYWNIIKFVVETVVFIIVAVISLIAIVAKAVWEAIAASAEWLWNTILLPIFNALKAAWDFLWAGMKVAADMLWTGISTAAQWFWNTILLPIINAIQFTWNAIWTAMLWVAQTVWNGITAAAQWVWSLLEPIFTTIGSAGSSIWEAISGAASVAWELIKSGWDTVWGFLSGIWDKLKTAGSAVWDGIKSAAETATGIISGAWDKVVGIVKGAWNFIANGWNSIPSITVPDWVPGIGGQNFSLPKLPTLWHGGEVPGGGRALVGEHGPEPLVQNGRVTGMVGQHGPEVRSLPPGGYVVPNLSTLSALPGLAKSIPSGVASAVARSVPGYGPVVSSGGDGTAALTRAVGALATAVAERPPPIVASGEDVAAKVEAILRQRDRESRLRKKYGYE